MPRPEIERQVQLNAGFGRFLIVADSCGNTGSIVTDWLRCLWAFKDEKLGL